MKTPRCFWIAAVGAGKSERPVIALHDEPGRWILAATGTTQDRPDREPPPRVHVRATSRSGKALGLTRDTWFDRLSFTVDLPPHRFEGPGHFVSGGLAGQLIDLFQACVEARLVEPKLIELAPHLAGAAE